MRTRRNLFLGAAETVVGFTDTFKPYPERRGLYRTNTARAVRTWRRAGGAAGAETGGFRGALQRHSTVSRAAESASRCR